MRISNNRVKLLTCIAFSLGIVVISVIYDSTYVLATTEPTSNSITTKLTDSLKSITSNISTSVQDTVDEVIADTMDILIIR